MSQISEDIILKTAPTIFGGVADTVSKGGNGLGGDILIALQENGFPINESNYRIANSPVEVIYGYTANAGSGILMVRVVVILKKPMPLVKATKIARAIGGRGGVIRSDFAGQIRSAFGNWAFQPVGGFLTALTPYLNPPVGEAYVASHISFSESDKRGNYLSIYGDNNVMHTDIIMNGYSILGANNIDASVVNATRAARFDELAVNGKANFQGGIDAGGPVEVGGNLSITEGDMSVTSGNLVVPGGNITARGLRADVLEAEDLTTKDLYTETLNVEGGNTFISSNVTISGGASLDITGTLKATSVDAGEITTDKMMTKTLSVEEMATLNGATTINNTVSIDQLILDGCMKLGGADYGACN
jgi:hypothetical protein